MWCNIVGVCVCVYISWMCCSDEQNIQMFLGNLGFLLLLILTLTANKASNDFLCSTTNSFLHIT